MTLVKFVINAAGVWVVGGVEHREADEDMSQIGMFAESVTVRNRPTLLRILEDNILPGTDIWTDCWKDYLGLEELIDCTPRMQHHTVNHSKEFKSDEGVCTNGIEGVSFLYIHPNILLSQCKCILDG